MSPTVSEFGEHALLQRLQRYCPADVVGDDAAVIPPSPGHLLVISTDMLVDGVHFCDRTTTPYDIGWRTTTANLSDLAAMGANPLGVTLSLGLPPSLKVSKLDGIYRGMADCLGHHHTPLLGGDLCRSNQLTLSMTALGEVLPHQQILRSTAQPGDVIIATGVHGASKAGLELLLHPDWQPNLTPTQHRNLCLAHQRPTPRLDIPTTLRQYWPKLRISGMDSSDGLADAILQICQASQVGAQIQQHQIPMPASFLGTDFISTAQATHWALYGGEDFELILCLPKTIAASVLQVLQQDHPTATLVGEIVPQAGVQLINSRADSPSTALTLQQGFQHFTAP